MQSLTLAAVEELREHGYAGLTVRNVARRAGIAPATAYTYFTSKDHLVTELFWRRIKALPETELGERDTAALRATAVLVDIAYVLAGEPEFAEACSTAILGSDPDVKHLRDLIGVEIRRRLVSALGRKTNPDVITTLELVLSGAMVRAGTGHHAYAKLPDLLARACRVVTRGEE